MYLELRDTVQFYVCCHLLTTIGIQQTKELSSLSIDGWKNDPLPL